MVTVLIMILTWTVIHMTFSGISVLCKGKHPSPLKILVANRIISENTWLSCMQFQIKVNQGALLTFGCVKIATKYIKSQANSHKTYLFMSLLFCSESLQKLTFCIQGLTCTFINKQPCQLCSEQLRVSCQPHMHQVTSL